MHFSGAHHGHYAHARLQHAAAPAAAGQAAVAQPSVGQQLAGRMSDYALVHAGRQLRLGPIAFWIVVGSLVIMAAWTVVTATYFAFRDDVLTRLITRQAEMQFAYEDRIAELRSQVDRMSSRQLLDQEQVEQKLDSILRRQSTLESRASTLNALPDTAVTGAIKPPARGETRSVPTKPSPMNDTSVPAAPRDRRAAVGVEGTLARLQASLDRVEARQANALASIEESYDAKAKRIRNILSELGVDAGKLTPPSDQPGTGGPFVAPRLRPDSGTFDRQVHRVSLARVHVERLTRTLTNVPVRKPLSGNIDLASGFGVRMDPFIRAPAMHTGLDMQAQTGDAVRATAAGKVTVAGWQGGYGKMVEIDHGNGFVTRYGHLSALDVSVGQTIKNGQVVGKVGTTGRSTGPHLHYETRIDGDAVDPTKFLRAGSKLGMM
jgi:murein DD-endopeptidase MepM/ murein hydrolase activator NlpD